LQIGKTGEAIYIVNSYSAMSLRIVKGGKGKGKILTKQIIYIVERERLPRFFATLDAFGSAQ
jgi:hypothetical protein